MPLRPVVARPNLKALCMGMIAMVLVYTLGVVLNMILARWSLIASESRVVSILLPLVVYLASGGVAGYLARRAPIMHGALLGLLTMVLFAVLTLVLAGDVSLTAFLQLAVGAMVLCSIGAFLGDSIAHR
jgi:hypothetical protein